MPKIDQLVVGDIGSYVEYDANVSQRTISMPTKKTIKETVPFSNETYDFTAINGEIYWNNRTLEYVFEITADGPEELETKVQAFAAWVMNMMDVDIYDPFMTDYHFRGTFENMDVDDSEIEKATITVTFWAYPYKIANDQNVSVIPVTEAGKITRNIENNSCHKIIPVFISDVDFTVIYKNVSYAFSAGEVSTASIRLDVGLNTMIFRSTDGDGTVRVVFYEEVF